MENPIKMDDLGVPLFSETPKSPLNNHGYFSMHLEEHLFASTEAVAIAAKPRSAVPGVEGVEKSQTPNGFHKFVNKYR